MHSVDCLRELRSKLRQQFKATFLIVGLVLYDLKLNLPVKKDQECCYALNILHILVSIDLLANLIALLQIVVALLVVFLLKKEFAKLLMDSCCG